MTAQPHWGPAPAGEAPWAPAPQQPGVPLQYSPAPLPPPGAAVTGEMFRAQSDYDDRRKSLGVAYLLWFFFGSFGGHRFYLGRTGSAVAMLLLGLTIIGLFVTAVWALVDAFLIPGITAQVNERLKRESYGRYGLAV